jgi:hypothetical protein
VNAEASFVGLEGRHVERCKLSEIHSCTHGSKLYVSHKNTIVSITAPSNTREHWGTESDHWCIVRRDHCESEVAINNNARARDKAETRAKQFRIAHNRHGRLSRF